MDFLRIAKRRSTMSELMYILLNVGLAVATLLTVWTFESPLPAFGLVLLSKWRVFAVRPRYWLAHIQANTVDLIVSLGLVVLLYAAGSTGATAGLVAQVVLMVLYIAWLLLLKPRTKRALVVAQAGVAILIGVTALYSSAYAWPSSVVVIVMWVLGYAAARHVLSAYSETNLTFLSMVWGLIFAEIGWLAYHVTVAYTLPLIEGVKLPQIAIVAIALSFTAERTYASYAKHGSVKLQDVLLPMLLSLSVIAVVVGVFGGIAIGGVR